MGVLIWGLATMAVAAVSLAALLRFVLIPQRRFLQEDTGVVAKLGEEQRVAFEVKLTLLVCLIFLYPVMLTVLLHSKASMRFWCGGWLLPVALVVPIWILLCHLAVARGALSRAAATLHAVILPAISLALVCEWHAWKLGGQGAVLLANDCESFRQKADLERAWWAARDLFTDCSGRLANATGAGLQETALVVRFEDCEGYLAAYMANRKEWAYLSSLEQEHRCGGWCTPHAPLWAVQPRLQDSCSKAAARTIMDHISLMARQVTIYSGMVLLGACLVLLSNPGWLQSV